MIKIANKRTHQPTVNDFPIHRGTILGNLWTHIKGPTKLCIFAKVEKSLSINIDNGFTNKLNQKMETESFHYLTLFQERSFEKWCDIQSDRPGSKNDANTKCRFYKSQE